MQDTPITPSEFVALANQTFDYAYPIVTIVGELANYKVSKGKWIYADIKDDSAKLRCFGSVYQLPGPLEDGMMLEVVANPRLHPQFGFSLNIQSLRPVGEGSIKKAADLLFAKLDKEGLFADERKRMVPHAPESIGLIASEQSAGYADFIKILNARWQGVEVNLYDVQVQGESAPESIIEAIEYFNQQSKPPEVLVLIRGGGSADDLSAFSTEQVTRAVAGSRIPTLVAIGHETDTCLAELASDMRASTPSNASELLFPDRKEELKQLSLRGKSLGDIILQRLDSKASELSIISSSLTHHIELILQQKTKDIQHAKTLLESIHPKSVLKRGYAILQHNGVLVSSVSQIKQKDKLDITLQDGKVVAEVLKK